MLKIIFVCDWCEKERLLCTKDKNICHQLIWGEVVPFFGKIIRASKHDPFCGEICQKASEMAKEIVILKQGVFLKQLHGKTLGELKVIRNP